MNEIDKMIDEEIENILAENAIKMGFMKKWRRFIAALTPEEKGIMANHLEKPSLKKRLAFCSAIADASSGRMNDDELKQREKEANLKLKKDRQRANSK